MRRALPGAVGAVAGAQAQGIPPRSIRPSCFQRGFSSAPAQSAAIKDFRKKVTTGPSLQDFIQGHDRRITPSTISSRKAPRASSPVISSIDHATTIPHQHAILRQQQQQQEQEAAQPAVLQDQFGRFHNYLRISVTERCNLRCVYCMPADGVRLQSNDKMLSSDEIIRLAEIFVGLGVDKIRLTGGEPLVRKDLVALSRSLRSLGLKELAITTNGVAPRSKLIDLVDAGVTHFNVSLDTLNADRFASISRRPAKTLSTVLGTIDQLFESGLSGRVKLNCVVMRGVNDDELSDFAAMTKERALDVRFIEWMPFDSNGWNGNTFFSYEEMTARLKSVYPGFERDVDGKNDTTKWHRINGYSGRVGFITSMSQHFCGSCNRLRITADGKLKVCLFGAEDLSLRDALRAGRTKGELQSLIGNAVTHKKFSLGGQEDMYSLAKSKNRPMILIGG